MPHFRTCLDCGRITPAGQRRCDACLPGWRARERERGRRRPSRAIYDNPYWPRVRKKVIARDEVCVRCGSDQHLQVHHLVPPYQGGEPFDESNLVTVCRACHPTVEHQGIGDC
jgi:5-methylcytosine-specific restriction endonuclease McrA